MRTRIMTDVRIKPTPIKTGIKTAAKIITLTPILLIAGSICGAYVNSMYNLHSYNTTSMTPIVSLGFMMIWAVMVFNAWKARNTNRKLNNPVQVIK